MENTKGGTKREQGREGRGTPVERKKRERNGEIAMGRRGSGWETEYLV